MAAQADDKISTKYTLGKDSELRFEIEEKDAKAIVTLESGYAEVFGTEMVRKKPYEFSTGAKIAIFSYHGCVIKVNGKTDVIYSSKETPMIMYLNSHYALDIRRESAEREDKRGPVVLICGPTDVGKTTLCRIFLNYAVRQGRRPLFVDLDVGQGSISIPGTMSAILIERPADIVNGFAKKAPLIYHFGHKTPSGNSALYKSIITKLANTTLNTFSKNKRTKNAGIVINTCGWIKGDGYKNILHTARAFDVSDIFVLDQERLYNELLRDIKSKKVNIVLLPKSGGVVEINRELRMELRDAKLQEYFYGNRITPLYPFSIELKFNELKLYKIGAPQLPASCMPLGMKAENNKTKLVAVTPNQNLLHHMLSLSFAQSLDEDVIASNIMGFVCVTKVDMERQSITVLSPQPRPLPNNLLLLSELQFMDNHT